MIDVQHTPSDTIRLIIQGNRSMSWRANLWLAASLGVICMGIALAMASVGLWMVIPFAGVEVLFIVACLYWTLRRLTRKEIITVDEQVVQLEWGYKKPEKSANLPRQWCQLRYHCPDNPFEVGELSVTAHGRRYRLGEALGREEKKTLHGELAAALQKF